MQDVSPLGAANINVRNYKMLVGERSFLLGKKGRLPVENNRLWGKLSTFLKVDFGKGPANSVVFGVVVMVVLLMVLKVMKVTMMMAMMMMMMMMMMILMMMMMMMMRMMAHTPKGWSSCIIFKKQQKETLRFGRCFP